MPLTKEEFETFLQDGFKMDYQGEESELRCFRCGTPVTLSEQDYNDNIDYFYKVDSIFRADEISILDIYSNTSYRLRVTQAGEGANSQIRPAIRHKITNEGMEEAHEYYLLLNVTVNSGVPMLVTTYAGDEFNIVNILLKNGNNFIPVSSAENYSVVICYFNGQYLFDITVNEAHLYSRDGEVINTLKCENDHEFEYTDFILKQIQMRDDLLDEHIEDNL